ncbi:MAG: hypothetical protein FWH17_03740 [Oscillospiraceae bacterium]|nr:hypothetical protein [Oscillospiraceae bacterium]
MKKGNTNKEEMTGVDGVESTPQNKKKSSKKKIILIIAACVLLLFSVVYCVNTQNKPEPKPKTYIDVSDKIYLGSTNKFETQEVAEALLTSKGIPYTVADAGTTSESYLAEVSAERISGSDVENGQGGYYVNNGETVVLKVFTYVEPQTPDPTPTPTVEPDNNGGTDIINSPGNADPTSTPPSTPDGASPSPSPSSSTPTPVPEPTPTPAPTASPSTYNWQQFLKDYEKWIDDYVAFMKKYQANPTDLSLLTDYLSYMEKLTEWSQRAGDAELELANNPEALKEYSETLARILLKLNDIN